MEKQELLEQWYCKSKQTRSAIEDGIDIDFVVSAWHGRKTERPIYNIPCKKCNRIIKNKGYHSNIDYYCDYCKDKNNKVKKEMFVSDNISNVKTKADIRFEKAVDEIKKQSKDFDKYKKAINIAKERCEKYGSIPEAMVAIELLKLGYSIIPQQKIKQYKVDFVLRKQKIIIEVDGDIFHKDYEKEKRREVEILYAVGFDWKIIRVSAEEIKEDINKLRYLIYSNIS
jgi:very-short-patch-repair endonuclease